MESSTIVLFVIVLILLVFLFFVFTKSGTECTTTTVSNLRAEGNKLMWDYTVTKTPEEFIVRFYKTQLDLQNNLPIATISPRAVGGKAQIDITRDTKVATVALKACPNQVSVISY